MPGQFLRSSGHAPCVGVAAVSDDLALAAYEDGSIVTLRAADGVSEVERAILPHSDGARAVSVVALPSGHGSAFAVAHGRGVTLGRVADGSPLAMLGVCELASSPTCVHIDAVNMRLAHGDANGRLMVRRLEPAAREGAPPPLETRTLAGGAGPCAHWVSFSAHSPDIVLAAG